MTEQVDVRSVISLVRRRRWWLVAVALVGAFLGAALVTAHPPLYSSTSQVLLPEPPVADGSQSSSWEASTQVSIAESDAVLGPAAHALSRPLSRQDVRGRVDVSASTADVLRITARGTSPEAATELAQAVAEAEVAYQEQASSSLSAAELATLRERRDGLVRTRDTVQQQIARTQQRLLTEGAETPLGRRDASALAQLTGQQTELVLDINQLDTKMGDAQGTSLASIIQEATPAERPRLLLWYVMAAIGLAALAVALATLVMVNLSRRDSKLGTRDEIADAVGSEVVASLRSHVPRSVAGWRDLLGSYSPSVAEGWAVRQALAGLGLEHFALDASDGAAVQQSGTRHRVCVLSLEDDVRALSMGPQLASYAASIGIATRLVPQQGDATAALWAACSSPAGDEQLRPDLRVASRSRTAHEPELTVIAGVLDRRSPVMPRLDRTAKVVLAVSSRAASSEDLARAAVVAYESGFRISGVVVADPDPFDRTTGRLLLHERLQQRPLPSRAGGPRPVTLREAPWTGGAS